LTALERGMAETMGRPCRALGKNGGVGGAHMFSVLVMCAPGVRIVRIDCAPSE